MMNYRFIAYNSLRQNYKHKRDILNLTNEQNTTEIMASH